MNICNCILTQLIKRDFFFYDPVPIGGEHGIWTNALVDYNYTIQVFSRHLFDILKRWDTF